MDKKNYNKKIQSRRDRLYKILGNTPVIKETYGSTKEGWGVIETVFIIHVKPIAKQIKSSRNFVKAELKRGMDEIKKKRQNDKVRFYCYSPCVSEQRRERVVEKIKSKHKEPKIFNLIKLFNFVILSILKGICLKAIAGRSKIEKLDGTISSPTLYKYVKNKKVPGIDLKAIIKKTKSSRHKIFGKRQNGTSIDECPEFIKNGKEFGHWEMDLKGVSIKSKLQLLILQEKKTRFIIPYLLENKKAATITAAIRDLQEQGILIFGKNCKSITTDNGSEFWGWEDFSQAIDSDEKINVYFAHPRAPWEKGRVENANGLIATALGDKIVITYDNWKAIKEEIDKINHKWRECLGYRSAFEMYTYFTQIYLTNDPVSQMVLT